MLAPAPTGEWQGGLCLPIVQVTAPDPSETGQNTVGSAHRQQHQLKLVNSPMEFPSRLSPLVPEVETREKNG